MAPIDPTLLFGLPAPFWFIQFFKILGFALHCIPMAIWFVGLPLALVFRVTGKQNARRFSIRMFKQLPVLMALGINFGIVPLLFIQTAYYKAFYTSTILMAIHWFSIIVLVGIAYYALYACSFLVEQGKNRSLLLCGLLATACLWGVSLLFSAQWALMESPNEWIGIWEKTSVAGAVNGGGSFWFSPLVYLRWGMALGVALLTLAFWAVFDAFVLCRTRSFVPLEEDIDTATATTSGRSTSGSPSPKMSKKEKKKQKRQQDSKEDDNFDEEFAALEAAEQNESKNPPPKKIQKPTSDSNEDTIEGYRTWAVSMASSLAWLGFLLAAGSFQSIYFSMIDAENPNFTWFYESPWKYLAWGTLSAFLFPPLLLVLGKWGKLKGKILVILLLTAEIALLATYATTRQFLQNARLADWLDVATLREQVEWSPLYTFLGTFVVTLLIILWMIRQMVIAGRPEEE